jgi:hypothetical protein
MRAIKYQIIVMLLLIASVFKLSGQNQSGKILESIVNAYKGEFSLSFEAKYRYYENFTTKTVSDSLDSYTVIHDDNYYFKIADYELSGNDKYSIYADNKSRQIVLGKFSDQENKKKSFNFIESLLKTSGVSIVEFDPGNGMKGLTFNYSGQQITRADIVYDPKSFLISKCTLKYLERLDPKTGEQVFSRLEIIYDNYKSEKESAFEDNYSISRFVEIENNKTYSVMKRFSGYEFINLTPLKKN